jgi:hypothetical protein
MRTLNFRDACKLQKDNTLPNCSAVSNSVERNEKSHTVSRNRL